MIWLILHSWYCAWTGHNYPRWYPLRHRLVTVWWLTWNRGYAEKCIVFAGRLAKPTPPLDGGP